jgi:hypothetical protein
MLSMGVCVCQGHFQLRLSCERSYAQRSSLAGMPDANIELLVGAERFAPSPTYSYGLAGTDRVTRARERDLRRS